MYILLLLYVFLTECRGLILNARMDDPPTIVIFWHMTSDFGISLTDPSYETSAPMVAIKREDGCDDIENGSKLEGSIVIVKRGQCSFFKKAWNVASYGGIGLVVGNHAGSELVHMYKSIGENRDVDIPCVFVTEEDYNSAIETLSLAPANSVIATISAGEEYPGDNLWSPVGLTTVVVYMLLIFPLAWTVLVIFRSCSRMRNRRIMKRQVRVIPEVIFSTDMLGAKGLKNKHLTNNSCPICLEDFEEKTRIKLLPCDHGFHPVCIEPWISQHKDSCPICQRKVSEKLALAQRDATCCYNNSIQRRQRGGSNQSLVEAARPQENQEMESSSTTDSSDLNGVEQSLELNDLNESTSIIEAVAAELTPKVVELPPFLTIIVRAEEKQDSKG